MSEYSLTSHLARRGGIRLSANEPGFKFIPDSRRVVGAIRYRPQVATLTAAETKVLDALDEAALIDTLVRLVQVPSITASDAESDLQALLGGRLREAGLDVDAWRLDLPALTADPRFPGVEVERAEGYGLVGVLPGSLSGSPALALQGHVDVVPVGDIDRWSGTDPFSARIDAGVVHGRGACDMKAGVAVNLAVVDALVRSGLRLQRSMAIHSVVSEEDGGLGAFATLVRGHSADFAVITEPTSRQLVVANAGALTFELRVPGRAAHGSRRLEGHSAFESFLPVHRALVELERERNAHPEAIFGGLPLPYPISVGRISAGDWSSSVPDLLIAEGRFGVQLGEDPATAREAFERAIADAAAADGFLAEHPVAVSWPGGQFASGAIDLDSSLISATAQAVSDATGREKPVLAAAPYGSDLRLYNGIGGIPTLHYGPGDVAMAHAPREQVEIAEVIEAARAMALLAVRLCVEPSADTI